MSSALHLAVEIEGRRGNCEAATLLEHERQHVHKPTCDRRTPSRHVDVCCSPQGREEIQEDDLFTALEKIQQERLGGSMNSSQSTDETVRMAGGRPSVHLCAESPIGGSQCVLPPATGCRSFTEVEGWTHERRRWSSMFDQKHGSGVQVVPAQLRRNIAVYEAARSLLGYITPDFDEVAKVRPAKLPVIMLVLPVT